MVEAFDPYHRWLGIPPEEQPPDYYRLLALRLFEEKPDVIESAADQRMTHLKNFKASHDSALRLPTRLAGSSAAQDSPLAILPFTATR